MFYKKIIIWMIMLFPLAGFCQKNSALLIFNSDLRSDEGFMRRQISELERVLEGLGFEVITLDKPDKLSIEIAIEKIFDEKNKIFFFFYLGNIYQYMYNKEYYLTPHNKINDLTPFELFSLSELWKRISLKNSELKILMFDIISPFSNGIPSSLEWSKADFHKIPYLLNLDNRNDVIVSANNTDIYDNLNYLKELIHELRKPNQTIKNSFKNLSNRENSAFDNIPSELLWNGMSRPLIMPIFPFPPPKASAIHILERKYFEKARNLFEVGQILDNSLVSCGYQERSYYQIPEGFALVTRIEKIKKDVSPFPEPERWNAPYDPKYGDFSLKDYFESLFFAKTGKYRIIVFLVTSIPFNQTESKLKLTEAENYLKRGYNSLPDDFQSIKCSKEHKCTALIYEFNKVEYEKGQLVGLSNYLGSIHLTKNHFIPILTKANK